jgi:transcriptional regulator with XRE-family HTH domain
MIDNEDFTKRLQEIMELHGESASSFAEKIGVQRSSISHILSGRNKPSLDFVLKILSAFPDVELYWLLNGKGPSPILNKLPQSELKNSELPKDLKFENNDNEIIERIVIFYTDGTFKNFKN